MRNESVKVLTQKILKTLVKLEKILESEIAVVVAEEEAEAEAKTAAKKTEVAEAAKIKIEILAHRALERELKRASFI